MNEPLRESAWLAKGMRVRGQALLLALVWIVCAAGCFLLAFEVGRVLNAKQRLVSAADAASLSAMAFEARVLNFDSYVNRAIVANEVAIAHALTLSSWLDYVDRTVSRADQVARFVPYVAQVSAVLKRVVESANAAIQPVVMPMPGVLSASSAMLATSAETLHSSVPIVVPDLIHRNLAVNDANARLSLAGKVSLAAHLEDWLALSKPFSGAERGRLADLVHRSRDSFSAQRGHRLSAGVARVDKRGGTDLVTYESWRAMDTLAAHIATPVGVEELSLGWGSASSGRRSLVRGVHGQSHAANPRTSLRAIGDSRQAPGYRGLPSLRDVRSDSHTGKAEIVLDLEVEREAQHVPSVLGDLGARGGAQSNGGPLRARASARVFHERSTPRADGRAERANLYSPYWHARLAPSSPR